MKRMFVQYYFAVGKTLMWNVTVLLKTKKKKRSPQEINLNVFFVFNIISPSWQIDANSANHLQILFLNKFYKKKISIDSSSL